MKRVYEIRQEFGNIYATVFSEDLVVPWHPLTLSDFIQYQETLGRGLIPTAILEDEIFRRCVVDEAVVRRMPELDAGVVSSVVEGILIVSGPPADPVAFQQDLDAARNYVRSYSMLALSEFIHTISIAFQYNPDQILAMDYEHFMKTLALAEQKLLSMGMMKQPLVVQSSSPPEPGPQPTRPKIDAKRAWEAQQKPAAPARDPKKKWWKVSPILEAESTKRINFAEESMIADDDLLDNHERREHPVVKKHLVKMKTGSAKDEMVAQAQDIYKDVLVALEKKKGR